MNNRYLKRIILEEIRNVLKEGPLEDMDKAAEEGYRNERKPAPPPQQKPAQPPPQQQKPQQPPQKTTDTAVAGAAIKTVKREGDYIVVTVESNSYPGVVGVGKAKFRGDMDFARDTAAAEARRDLATKVKK